jgi:predicted metal-dependent enzyme (double-stranded beta helix superfamily)
MMTNHRRLRGFVANFTSQRGFSSSQEFKPDGVSVGIHFYGANIGTVRRRMFDAVTDETELFVSGYSRDNIPKLWIYFDEIRSVYQ